MSDETLQPITGTLPQGSIADPANFVDGVGGEASGTVGGGGIEAALAAMGLTEPQAPRPVAPFIPPDAISPSTAQFRVRIAGGPTDADVYVSNGSLEMRIPRNKDVRVPAAVVDALKVAEGIEFTYLPD